MLWLKAGVIAWGLEKLGSLWSDSLYLFFAWPSAKVAALFLGVPVTRDTIGHVWIPLPVLPIHVTSDCTGYGFFCLLIAMMGVFYASARRNSPLWLRLVAVLLISYGVTIVTNGLRMVSGYKIHLLVSAHCPFLPSRGVHLVVGMTIFLTVFLLVYLILKRMKTYEPFNAQTAAA